MENKYDIESLIKTFSEHAEKVALDRKKLLEINPDFDINEDDFSLPLAFIEMCKEIKKLKEEMNHGRMYQRFPL